VATIGYVTNANPGLPKEIVEVSADNRSARFDNFKRATVWSGRSHKTRRIRGRVDKGQAAALSGFLNAVATGGPMPIPLSSLLSTTAVTIAAERSLSLGGPQKL